MHIIKEVLSHDLAEVPVLVLTISKDSGTIASNQRNSVPPVQLQNVLHKRWIKHDLPVAFHGILAKSSCGCKQVAVSSIEPAAASIGWSIVTARTNWKSRSPHLDRHSREACRQRACIILFYSLQCARFLFINGMLESRTGRSYISPLSGEGNKIYRHQSARVGYWRYRNFHTWTRTVMRDRRWLRQDQSLSYLYLQQLAYASSNRNLWRAERNKKLLQSA